MSIAVAPRLRHRFAATRLLELWVGIPLGGMDVCLLWVFECCQVEASMLSWSFVQRNPTECGVSNECDHKAPQGQAMTRNRAEVPQENNALINMYYILCVRQCCFWGFRSSGIWCCVTGWVFSEVSKLQNVVKQWTWCHISEDLNHHYGICWHVLWS